MFLLCIKKVKNTCPCIKNSNSICLHTFQCFHHALKKTRYQSKVGLQQNVIDSTKKNHTYKRLHQHKIIFYIYIYNTNKNTTHVNKSNHYRTCINGYCMQVMNFKNWISYPKINGILNNPSMNGKT